MAKNTKSTKKRVVRIEAQGKAFIYASFNNVIVSLTNNDGQVISWSSAGKMGYRGSKKNTPYAAQMVAQDCAKVAYDLGLRSPEQPSGRHRGSEARIQEETKATIRCIPVDSFVVEEEGKCVYSGKPSHQRVIFARSY